MKLRNYEKRLADHEEKLRYYGATQDGRGQWDYTGLYELPDDGMGGVDMHRYCSESERNYLIERHGQLQGKVAYLKRLPGCTICGEPTFPSNLDEDGVCPRKRCKHEFGESDAV